MEIQSVLTLIQAFSDHGLTELDVEDNGFKISLKKDNHNCIPGLTRKENGMAETASKAIMQTAVQGMAGTVNETGVPKVSETVGVMSEEEGNIGTVPAAIESDKVVVSPLVGVFYSASSPDAENFVKVGDIVKKGQVLGIIEAMKLMNEIESEYDGVVEAILVKNEDVVEYNQPLFRIR